MIGLHVDTLTEKVSVTDSNSWYRIATDSNSKLWVDLVPSDDGIASNSQQQIATVNNRQRHTPTDTNRHQQTITDRNIE